MIEPQDNNDRWGELAAQLGLDESSKTPPAPQTPPPEPPSELFTPRLLPESDSSEGDVPAIESVPGDDETQKRRRGRRSGRGRRKAGPEDGDGRAEGAGAEGDGGLGRKRKRGRRAPATAGEDADSPDESRRSNEPADDDEVDNLSGWTVPSWTDLIDSLYRPDR